MQSIYYITIFVIEIAQPWKKANLVRHCDRLVVGLTGWETGREMVLETGFKGPRAIVLDCTVMNARRRKTEILSEAQGARTGAPGIDNFITQRAAQRSQAAV